MAKLLKSSTEFDENSLSRAIEDVIKYLDVEDAINKDAKAARNAVDRLVSTAHGARTKVLNALNQFEVRDWRIIHGKGKIRNQN